jgi:hypothetical protein
MGKRDPGPRLTDRVQGDVSTKTGVESIVKNISAREQKVCVAVMRNNLVDDSDNIRGHICW